MTTDTVIRARVPSMLETSPIVATQAGATFRIHPEDLRELREAYRFVWPDNAPRDVFRSVQLVADADAPRLPRRRL